MRNFAILAVLSVFLAMPLKAEARGHGNGGGRGIVKKVVRVATLPVRIVRKSGEARGNAGGCDAGRVERRGIFRRR